MCDDGLFVVGGIIYCTVQALPVLYGENILEE